MLRGWGKKGSAVIVSGAALMLFSACGSQITDDVLEEIDPPQIDYIEDEAELNLEVMEEDVDDGQISAITEDDEENLEEETDMTEDEEEIPEEKGGPVVTNEGVHELYLVDANGMVAPQTMEIQNEGDEYRALVEHLIEEGPVTEMLPDGFQAVLPAGTEVLSAELESDGSVTVDFNEFFAEYHPSRELHVLQSLTWTLTQLDEVDRVKLKMNGEELQAMPVNQTPVSSGYTREHGINLEMNDETDLVSTVPVVVYFLAQEEDNTYYVPVTRRVSEGADRYEAVVKELLDGPHYASGLLTDFRQETELLETPDYSDGTVTLNFNEALLSQLNGTAVSENVLNMLVLSLTEQADVERVSLMVESDPDVMVSNGESLSEAVVRPENVNAVRF